MLAARRCGIGSGASVLLAALFYAATAPPVFAASGPDDAAYARNVEARALAGDVGAQYEIGRLYAKGAGVRHDYPKAAKWYLRAARGGHAEAQLSIGILYEEGTAVPRDPSRAAHWYREAAQRGDARAQMRLGYLYGIGRGVTMDHVQAYLWYSLAARQGVELARVNQKAAEVQLTSPELARARALVRDWQPRRSD